MENATTIGADIAKNVFQVPGVDADGATVVRQRLTRGRMLKFFAKLPRCLIGIEAFDTSHFWGRELVALGHDVKPMPAQYVSRRSSVARTTRLSVCGSSTFDSGRLVGLTEPKGRSAARFLDDMVIMTLYFANAASLSGNSPTKLAARVRARQRAAFF